MPSAPVGVVWDNDVDGVLEEAGEDEPELMQRPALGNSFDYEVQRTSAKNPAWARVHDRELYGMGRSRCLEISTMLEYLERKVWGSWWIVSQSMGCARW